MHTSPCSCLPTAADIVVGPQQQHSLEWCGGAALALNTKPLQLLGKRTTNFLDTVSRVLRLEPPCLVW